MIIKPVRRVHDGPLKTQSGKTNKEGTEDSFFFFFMSVTCVSDLWHLRGCVGKYR